MVRENDGKYLMVEGNHYDVEIAFFDFKEHGIEPDFHVARDGVEALDYLLTEDGHLRVEPPKVIFIELHMRKIDGLEFLRIIKSNEQTQGIPVVVLESSISVIEENECKRLGVKDFMRKPLEYESFLNTIRDIEK